MNTNELRKDLMRSKVQANFSHYCEGKLYYTVEALGGKYQFPIAVNQPTTISVETYDENGNDAVVDVSTIKLSEDLGITPFRRDNKGSELTRWMLKAIETEEFIKIG